MQTLLHHAAYTTVGFKIKFSSRWDIDKPLFIPYRLTVQLLGWDLPSTREITLAPFSPENNAHYSDGHSKILIFFNGVNISVPVDPRPTKVFTVCIITYDSPSTTT